MIRPKTWDSLWGAILDSKLKAHWRWYDGGRTGDGRIVMADENLQGAAVRCLAGARFDRCDFSGSNFSIGDLRYIEVADCTFDEGTMIMSQWQRARIVNCRFRGSWLGQAHFDDATIEGGDWLGCFLECSDWTRARVTDVSFRAATLVDATFDEATFIDCDFTDACLFRKVYDTPVVATCRGTRFVGCNFTRANLDGLRLDHTVFERCKFVDMIGKPALEGPCKLIEPDLTLDIDDELHTEAEVLAMWRTASAIEIGRWARRGKPKKREPGG